METITVKPVRTKEENTVFWSAKNEYLIRDILPFVDLGVPITEEDKAYLLSEQYTLTIEKLCSREKDRAQKVFFYKGEQMIGFSLYCTYLSEDGKCFILDFCVFPPFRDCGLGKQCFAALRAHTRAQGAAYYDLNTHCKRSRRFWQSLGFVYNGYDAHGSICLLLPPPDLPVYCEELAEADLWQIPTLENSRYYEIQQDFLSEQQQEQFNAAIQRGNIRCFVIKRAVRVVGIYYIHTNRSMECGTLYIAPAFREKGYEQRLLSYVQTMYVHKNEVFWEALDQLLAQSEIVIDRPKGTAHPRYPDFIYKLDYGYLSGTTSMDGGGIDVWVGTDPAQRIDAIICIVDLVKRDSEIKLLVGCTEAEKEAAYQTHNETPSMKGVLIRRS